MSLYSREMIPYCTISGTSLERDSQQGLRVCSSQDAQKTLRGREKPAKFLPNDQRELQRLFFFSSFQPTRQARDCPRTICRSFKGADEAGLTFLSCATPGPSAAGLNSSKECSEQGCGMADHVGRVSRKGAGTLLALGGGFCVRWVWCFGSVFSCVFFSPLLDKIQQWCISCQKPLLLLLPRLC